MMRGETWHNEGSNPSASSMKKRITLTEDQAKEMYYNINSYFLFLQCAENVDKVYFDRLKFWSPIMNNHLSRARRSVATLMTEFNRAFKAVDEDKVLYDTPSELYRAMEMFSRMPVEKIKQILDDIEGVHGSE